MIHNIDAKRKSLGRVAAEAASYLMGKNAADFQRNAIPETKVAIANASKMSISDQKMRDKEYIRHSAFPGGQKVESLEQLANRRGYGEVVRKAVYGMLPDNKLRKIMMINLTVTE